MDWYKHENDEVISILGTCIDKGLEEAKAEKRLDSYGKNELQEVAGRSIGLKILDQFSDFLVIILIFAALISMLIGEIRDSVVILAIVVLNAALGIYQEGKAEKALEALKKISSPTAKVLRDGKRDTIPTSNLVPGDIVILEAGDIIPADIRLVENYNLKIDESSLTGESVPVEKNGYIHFSKDTPLGDRENMAFMSTIVTYGRGKGIVVETGHNTEIGKIATQIQSFEEELTPLQKKLNQLGKYLGIITIIVCIIVFAIGIVQGRGILEMLMVSISLAVAAIPEGLPAIVTIVLALGMNKMVARHAIVKKLLAVETLGSTTVICSDKTGTLTQNEMTVVKVFTDNKLVDVTGVGYNPVGKFILGEKEIKIDQVTNLKTLLSIGVLANDASITNLEEGFKVIGDPTEGALMALGQKGGIFKEKSNKEYPRIEEIPFDSTRKMMTTFHKNYIKTKIVAFTKGAPDIVIDRCKYINIKGEILPLDKDIKEKLLGINDYFAKDALRVLALAYKAHDKLPTKISSDNIEDEMVLVGLVGMIDPPRPEAKAAIMKCKEAGIKPVMITGDYKETAFAIAKELGISESIEDTMTGEKLDKLTDRELRHMVKDISVYARVSPEHKVRIVSALKAMGEIVAMTGDGVNDSMALKRADIGISMGITGTDVAKNTAEVILTDDNFASIVSAVEEGRVIYSNIRKFVFFLLSCNIGEIIIVFASILLNLPIPLLPIQLLWLNLVTDSLPALALGVEKGEEDIMQQAPRNPESPIIDRSMMIDIGVQSISIGIASLAAYIWGIRAFPGDITKARTIIFSTLILAELLRAYTSRSEKYILAEIGIFSNPAMVYGTSISFFLLLAVIYIPMLQPIFHTESLALVEWGVIASFAFLPLIVGELYKVIFNRRNKK